MKGSLVLVALATVPALTCTAPVQAAVVLPGSSGITPDDFSLISGTQGLALASSSFSGQTGTFNATVRTAVYRNTLGTLDFYYQVSRLGPGTGGSDLIKELTTSIFGTATTNVYRSIADPDGAGFFLPNSQSSVVPITTVGRTPNGNVLTISFALPNQNGIGDSDTTSTYIFRTDAVQYGPGFASIQDGTSLSGAAYAPLSAIPEPASWGMFIGGFGLVGGAMRRRRMKRSVA